jgi:DNA-directed RNA polymerase specialized sigma24 family protein
MDRVKTPDRARFQALCQSLRPDLARFAFWLYQDRAVAEDVVQESMLRAWSAKASLQDEKVAKPWFSPIVRRELARTFERKRLTTVDVDGGLDASIAAGYGVETFGSNADIDRNDPLTIALVEATIRINYEIPQAARILHPKQD